MEKTQNHLSNLLELTKKDNHHQQVDLKTT